MTTWPTDDDRPSPGAILKSHAQIDDAGAADIQSGLDVYDDTAVWLVGGDAED